jgi:hypothetical protein
VAKALFTTHTDLFQLLAPPPSSCNALSPSLGCPAGCDYCRDGVCVVHARGRAIFGKFITCPPEASNMPCLVLCDTLSCDSLDLQCTSNVRCDFACVEPADCSWVAISCPNPLVPCRAHCEKRSSSRRDMYHFGLDSSITGVCSNASEGMCRFVYHCVPGISCYYDACSDIGCEGGTPVLERTPAGAKKCSCKCPAGLVAVYNTWGEATCITSEQDPSCSCLDPGKVCIAGKCICSGARDGPFCENSAFTRVFFNIVTAHQSYFPFLAMESCPQLTPPTTLCPADCTECDTKYQVCRIIDPDQNFSCPVGWNCIIKCYDKECNGIVGSCTNGAGPCDWYCFGNRSCLMATMVCSTLHPCRSHCSTQDPARHQVLANHVCLPGASGLESCDCKTSCLLQVDVQNPCYLNQTRALRACFVPAAELSLLSPRHRNRNPG